MKTESEMEQALKQQSVRLEGVVRQVEDLKEKVTNALADFARALLQLGGRK